MINENSAHENKTGFKNSKELQVIIDLFKGRGQTEIPLRSEVVEHKQNIIKEKKNKGKTSNISSTRKGILVANRKSPSRTYLSNLNPRITKADRLWKKIWMHEKGNLLRTIGITDNELISQLAEQSRCPDEVIDYFIMNKNQPKEFHHAQTDIGGYPTLQGVQK